MAGPDRDLDPSWRAWSERLVADPGRFDFVDAVDLLVRFADPVVLRHGTSLGFSRGEIEAVKVDDAAGKPRAELTASFFGLAGETSPLPLGIAEEADRDDDHGAVVRGLLDIFHQRLLALLHAAVASLDYPHSFRADGKDPWTRSILALLGLADRPNLLSPAQLLRLAPILATGVSSPEMLSAGLRVVLDGWLDRAQVRCLPFTGEWMEIDRPDWSRLGSPTAAVGVTSVLGTSVLNRAGAAKIVIGPLSGTNYRHFLAGGQAHARVMEFTGAFIDAPVRLEMMLEVEDVTYPPGRLGERRLGDDLWLARTSSAGLATKIRVPLGEEEAR